MRRGLLSRRSNRRIFKKGLRHNRRNYRTVYRGGRRL
ncbi:hypothetical protein [Peromfec virus RodF7_15]|uniref:Uncharacterized protein n=1 Tax=Peromfec virus RodF7_15 TaxID=2929350 RepID=A0A976R8U5_9VIRU|nr:hypothetical protein [Peromfec virus RodF7_15]